MKAARTRCSKRSEPNKAEKNSDASTKFTSSAAAPCSSYRLLRKAGSGGSKRRVADSVLVRSAGWEGQRRGGGRGAAAVKGRAWLGSGGVAVGRANLHWEGHEGPASFSPQLRVAQHLVRLAQRLELLLSFGVLRILVWVHAAAVGRQVGH